MSLSEEKAVLRALALSRRRALSDAERAERSLAICRALEELPELSRVRTVLSYAAVGSECDLRALCARLRARGVTLAFPLTAADGTMEAYVPRGAMTSGRFGVPEPDPAAAERLSPTALDAVLVPCVGFDASLARLGHGKGYYDRYLRRCGSAAAILTAFEAQRLDAIPRETHDVTFSLLITEAGVFRKGASA